jgi:hypothetical protein
MVLKRLESADMIDTVGLIAQSFWDGLGRFRLFSTLRWSCIGRGKAKAPQQRGFQMGKGLVLRRGRAPYMSRVSQPCK